MNLLESVTLAVEQALSTERAGTLVAGRFFVHTLSDRNDIPLLLARLLRQTTKYFGSPVAHLYAHGSVASGEVSTLLLSEQGQSLLVSVGVRMSASPIVEFTLFGSRGIIASGGQLGHLLTGDIDTSWMLTDEERQLARLVRLSQQTRQSVKVSNTDKNESVGRIESRSSTFNIHRREERHPLSPPFGILLVAGEHTHQPGYASALAADQRCRLVAVVDEENNSAQRKEWNEQLANRLGIPVLPKIAEALDRPDVHAVSICAEPERRAPIIIEAARAGKHLYLDKPLCASTTEAQEIVAAVREAKVLAHMFSHVLWDPGSRAREVFTSGQLGDILAIHCDLSFAKGHGGTAKLGMPRVETPVPRQFEFPDAKRELTNIGVYGVVMILWLLRRQVRRVFATTGNYFFAEHQSRDVEDFGQMLLEMDGGISASVTATRCGWRSHPSSGLNRIFVAGSKGATVIDAHHPGAAIWSDTMPWTPPVRHPDDPMAMWAILPDSPGQAVPKQDWHAATSPTWATDGAFFFDCLEQGRDSEITVEIAAAATEVLSAAYRSAAERRVVTLPLIQ